MKNTGAAVATIAMMFKMLIVIFLCFVSGKIQ